MQLNGDSFCTNVENHAVNSCIVTTSHSVNVMLFNFVCTAPHALKPYKAGGGTAHLRLSVSKHHQTAVFSLDELGEVVVLRYINAMQTNNVSKLAVLGKLGGVPLKAVHFQGVAG